MAVFAHVHIPHVHLPHVSFAAALKLLKVALLASAVLLLGFTSAHGSARLEPTRSCCPACS